jgi:hypothetical protein
MRSKNNLHIIVPLKGRSYSLQRFLLGMTGISKTESVFITIAVDNEELEATRIFIKENFNDQWSSGRIKLTACFRQPFSRAGNDLKALF